MKDAQGIELEVGQRVAFTVGTEIKFGTVARLRTARRYNHNYDVAKVLLEVPEIRYGQARPLRDPNGYGYLRDANGMIQYAAANPNQARTTRDVDTSCRIAICPMPVVEEKAG
jgi:hypothetical protein